MSEIQRYEEFIDQAGNYIDRHPEGDWVKYEDHIKALEDAPKEDDRNPVEAFHQDLASLIQKYLPSDATFPTEPAIDLISWTLHGSSAFDKLPEGFLDEPTAPEVEADEVGR
jgi:hypothetical protein